MPSSRSAPRTTLKPQVVVPSLAVIGALLAVCALLPNEAGALFGAGQQWIVERFDWFYVLAITTFLIFIVLIAASRFGNIKLGPDDAEPEFSFVSWTAMLFAAGMGIGLMYFGVGEPIQHYLKPPTALGGTPAAAREAMLMSFFHWGLHAWATYGVMGLVLAYFGFRYNLPLTLRSGLYPVLREGVNGWIGHTVDAFALVGTVAGIAVTLGYGVLQLSAGLHTIAGWQTDSDAFRIGLVAVVVALAGLSAASGLDKGVRRLSELNLMLAFALLAFVVVAGPTSFLLRAFGDNVGEYLSKLVSLSFRTYAYEAPNDKGWFGGWTLLYWAWWVSWSPFVGMFIARISRGRTIREFVIGVLLVPTAFNLVWMTAFGNSAIWLDTHAAAGALAQTATNVDALLFRFFDYLPLTQLLSVAAIVLIAVFFVTSADSGAFVIDAIATRGAPHSPVWQRLFWAAVLGVTASVLLVAGGLKALQALTLVAALPVALVMLALCYGLWRGLKADHAHYSQEMAPATSFWTGQHWRQRLSQILRHTTGADARRFIAQTVEPALRKVADELKAGGVDAHVARDDDDAVRLTVPAPAQRDFVYGARVSRKSAPAFRIREAAEPEPQREHVCEVLTFFADGRLGYDIEYLRGDEIIADVLRQYERYVSLAADTRTHLLNRAPEHAGPDGLTQ
ncbi:transporter, betaine/carnitine/choline transporter family protein [Burkholderia thailandensis 34]|uniref:BCCT family transporter n=2 Tax=Burkholderia thailandensis TaxID=57975 RepID=UPI0005D83ED8|nr:BCCT family transporter [Burkholderia thailandensis]AJY31177.1 transporter, betaine/carnitine/choline transporter family protein [Burkholderia thailandensis 34]AOJ59851.1 transporter [Burkholderia thailandensis]KXF58971.1 transporter [Burkholderia thailandensis]MBS2130616.1 BCCT family transporter [Burkholderia thailandensis]PNE78446.1 BCCT family transporter [Burkholderia thailandensis]